MAELTLTFDMTSIDNLEAQLLAKLRQGQLEGGLSIREQAEEIMAESRVQVPEDTGTLASSGFVDNSELLGDPAVRIGYDGSLVNPKNGIPVSDYIMQVHEDLNAYHPKGKAKFFEDPVIQYTPKFESTMAAALAKALLG